MVHPYAAELMSVGPSLYTAVYAVSHGVERYVCNEGWSTHFFNEEEGNRAVLQEKRHPRAVLGRYVCFLECLFYLFMLYT